ncbi:hypothetical protein V2J09_021733 [Rumex salicifolius]
MYKTKKNVNRTTTKEAPKLQKNTCKSNAVGLDNGNILASPNCPVSGTCPVRLLYDTLKASKKLRSTNCEGMLPLNFFHDKSELLGIQLDKWLWDKFKVLSLVKSPSSRGIQPDN